MLKATNQTETARKAEKALRLWSAGLSRPAGADMKRSLEHSTGEPMLPWRDKETSVKIGVKPPRTQKKYGARAAQLTTDRAMYTEMEWRTDNGLWSEKKEAWEEKMGGGE